MDAMRNVLAVWVMLLVIVASARSQSQHGSLVFGGHQDERSSNPRSHLLSPSGTPSANIKFNFKGTGGALQTLGRQELERINTRVGLNVGVDALAAHLDGDQDLGVEAANGSLIYSCGCLATDTARHRAAAAQFAADSAAAAAAAAAAVVQRHTRPQATRQSYEQQLSDVLLTPGQPDPGELTASEVFTLSSRPGSKYKLVLDFDGSTLAGTVWNEASKLDTIVTPPYDKDGDPGTFNADELEDIAAVWRAVAEDYAPFDVDVTTADPGDAALTGVGQKVIIGGASSNWFGAAGGIAYVNSFGRPGMPCFVFPLSLGPNNPKFIWEAVAHELGHALGLLHDGVLPNPAMPRGTDYYSGQGSWAPLMGLPFWADVTTWDTGEYPFSNNNQDDLAVIGRWLPRAPVQAGTSISTATALTATPALPDGAASGAVSTTGVASNNSQPAFYSFTGAAGPVSISVAVAPPFGVGGYNQANLKASATVYDSYGTVLSTLPSSNMGIAATIVMLPSSGVYYIAVSGRGDGDPAAGGYSSYGSLGRYTLSIEPQIASAPTAVNCKGAWGSWSECDASCTQWASYSITRPAVNGGVPCLIAEGLIRTQPCSGGLCAAAIDDPIMVVTDITVTRDNPPAQNGTSRVAGSVGGSAPVRFSFCRAVVTVKTMTCARLANALVFGGWSLGDMVGFNPSAAAPLASTTFKSGQAVFRSRSWRTDRLSKQPPVTACEFFVSGVTLYGKTLDKMNSVMTQTLQWK